MRSLIGGTVAIVGFTLAILAGCTVKNAASDVICQPKQKQRCNDCTKDDPSDTRVWRGWQTCASDGKSFVGSCSDCAPDSDTVASGITGGGSSGSGKGGSSSGSGPRPDASSPVDAGPPPSPTKPPASDTEQACDDFADEIAYNADRCGEDADQQRKAFIDAIANGDCKNITSVRDIDGLYDTCFPSLDQSSCADLLAGNIDSSCGNQLVCPSCPSSSN
jgi:hypothetical protein